MNKKRLASLFTAVCLIMIFAFNCFAALGTADPDKPDEDISYADTVDEGATALDRPRTPVYENGISAEKAKIINALISYWNNYGLLTILVVLAVIVIIAVIVSSNEKKKLKNIKKKLHSDE